MSLSTGIRLALMMFLNYVVWGSWYTTINTYLTATLGFTGTQAGAVFGTAALACMISPLFVGLIADRFFATERVLCALHLAGAVLLYTMSRVTDFGSVYGILLLYNLLFFPTIPLTNSIALRHVSDSRSQFPLIRVFATIGWIVISVVIGQMRIESQATPFLIGSGCSVAMGLFCLLLPHTPPLRTSGRTTWKDMLGLDAIVLLRKPSYTVFLIASVLACIPLSFYFSFTNVYLNDAGVANAASKMSLGQVSEVGMMLAMPLVFRRLGIKAILLLGLAAWSLRYILLAYGDPGPGLWMFYAAILLHGICFDFFFMSGQIYTDLEAPAHLRSTAQGFLTLMTYGVGMFLGSMLSGTVIDAFTTSAGGVVSRNWTAFWLSSALGAGCIFLLMAVLFRSKTAAAAVPAPVPAN